MTSYRYKIFFSNVVPMTVVVKTENGEDDAHAKAYAKIAPQDREHVVGIVLMAKKDKQ